jgi:trimeric autotransporter adhesin
MPAALAAAASGAIGAQGRSFLVISRPRVLVASGGGVASSFTRAGVSLMTADGVAHLTLVAVGYGARLAAVPDVTPVAAGSSVSYQRGWLREWYRNGSFGLEQGFTLARRPAEHQPGPLTLALGIGGPLTARRSGSEIVLTTTGDRAMLSYGQLSARDATGRSLPAEIVPRGHRLVLRVWDRDAHYPLTIDPFIEQAKLAAPTSGAGKEIGAGLFGHSVALSAGGNTALIGGPRDHGSVGAVWVFSRKHGTWTDQHTLFAPTSGDGKEIGHGAFGYSVALSADGNTALVGGPGDHGGVGAAWAFIRKGRAWTDQQKLTAPTSGPGIEIGNAHFGSSVALSSTGNTALIGGPLAVGGRFYHRGVGAAWVFIRKGRTWTDQHKLIAPTSGAGKEIGDAKFGSSVALSASGGNTALIGGPHDHGPIGTNLGAAWVFIRNNRSWTFQRKLTPVGSFAHPVWTTAQFGFSVALSLKGNTALIGAPYDFLPPFQLGAGTAWVFRKGRTWTFQQKLTAGDESGSAGFGYSVALPPNAGNQLALIGGPYDNGNVGAAWFFVFGGLSPKNSAWFEEQKLTAPTTGAGKENGKGLFGDSVALSSTTPLIGGPNAAPGDAGGTGDVGAAWWWVFH